MLLLDCPNNILQQRLQARASLEGRFDDNAATIEKCLQNFRETTRIVLNRYEEQGNLLRIDAAKSKDEVFAEIKTRLIQTLPSLRSKP